MFQNKDYYDNYGKSGKLDKSCPINYKSMKINAPSTQTSWWAGAVSMLEPTQVGTQIGCAVNDDVGGPGSGGTFKTKEGF